MDERENGRICDFQFGIPLKISVTGLRRDVYFRATNAYKSASLVVSSKDQLVGFNVTQSILHKWDNLPWG